MDTLYEEYSAWLLRHYSSDEFLQQTQQRATFALAGSDVDRNGRMDVEEYKGVMERLYPGNPVSAIPCGDPRNAEVMNFMQEMSKTSLDSTYHPILAEFRRSVREAFPQGMDYTAPQECSGQLPDVNALSAGLVKRTERSPG